MHTFRNFLYLFLFSFVLFSCGKEIGRVKIDNINLTNEPNETEFKLEVKKRMILDFWSEMDMSYDEPLTLKFEIDIYRNDKFYKKIEFDPRLKSITFNEKKFTLSNHTSWSFYGKNFSLKIQEEGIYTFKTYLYTSENKTLKINSAYIVFKK